MQRRTIRSFTLLLIFVSFILVACDIGTLVAGKPTVVIASPPSGSQFREGEDVAIQSTSTDSSGISRVELIVDGAVVRTDPVPAPQVSYPLIQTWKATAGKHTLSVRAYNTSNNPSEPAAVTISVGSSASPTNIANLQTPGIPTIVLPTAAATDAPGQCTNNAAYVSDVTVPDGTVLAPGQTFNKIWRVRNNGTCAWEAGYQFVFVGGEAMTTSTIIVVPYTAPGATADLMVPMTAPAGPGTHAGQWRLKSASGAVFGTTVTVNIKIQPTPVPPTVTRTPAGCSGNPNISSFSATSTTIAAGNNTTLQWGAVTNADSVTIDHDIGGVATPDDVVVTPTATTTYTMTAKCGSNTVTKQVTITVNPTGGSIIRCLIPGESGTVISTGSPLPGTYTVGDDALKQGYRTFFSFDIHDIAGKTIDVGNLNIGVPAKSGDPFNNLGQMWIDLIDYGALDASDYGAAGNTILGPNTGPAGQYDIKSSIKAAVSASKPRFQLRFRFVNPSNSDDKEDSFEWGPTGICLAITYH